MSANIIDTSVNMSFSQESTSFSMSTGTQSNHDSQSNSSQPTTVTQEATVVRDSFEFSSKSSSTSITYNAPKQFVRSNKVSGNIATVRQTYFTPQGNKQLEDNINQMLSDFYGSDTPEMKEHKETLNNIKMLDPELAQKAMFLITLMDKEDAEKFLANMSKFSYQMNESNSNATSLNTVATASASATEDKRSATIENATNALEGFAETLSTKLNISINLSEIRFTGSNMAQFFNSNINGSLNINMCDPLVFDLAGDGIDLKSAENGVDFDIDGDGEKEQTAFIKGDDALLYLDKSGNGIADNGNELFGDQEGHTNGYSKLAQYDENNDGVIDKLDKVYSELRLWQDKNDDGFNQLSESMSLLEAGIESIQLKYNELNECDGKGNMTGQSSSFTRTDGSKGYTADMLFRNYSR